MKNKLLRYSILVIILLLSSITVNAADDAETAPQEGLNKCSAGGCDSWWSGGLQGIRVSLVYKDGYVGDSWMGTGSQGDTVRGTKSIDYSNDYKNLTNVKYFGYNSKLQYLRGNSLILKTGYSAKKPYGSMPSFVAFEESGPSTVVEEYFKSTFLDFNKIPFNLMSLLRDLGANELADYIDSQSDWQGNGNYVVLTKSQWEAIQKKFPYALIVEPILYVYIKDTQGLSVSVSESTVAVTAMEAAKLFPDSRIDGVNTLSPGNCFVCGVTHTNLPRSIYIQDQNYFHGTKVKIFSNSDNFGPLNVGTADRFRQAIGKTWYLIMKKDVASSAGIGIGYFDLWAYVKDIVPPPPPKEPDPKPPVPPVTTPLCVVGTCGKQSSFKDTYDWSKIMNNPNYIDASKGSQMTVTDWDGTAGKVLVYSSTNPATYNSYANSQPGNKNTLCSAYCRKEVSTSFPSQPDNNLVAGTHFVYGPIKTTSYIDCIANVALTTWQEDYDAVLIKKAIAEANLKKVKDKAAAWEDLKDGKFDTTKGTIIRNTFCTMENTAITPSPTRPTVTVNKVAKVTPCVEGNVQVDSLNEGPFQIQAQQNEGGGGSGAPKPAPKPVCIYNYSYTFTCSAGGASVTFANKTSGGTYTGSSGATSITATLNVTNGGASATATCDSAVQPRPVGSLYTWSYVTGGASYEQTYTFGENYTSPQYCVGQGSYADEVSRWQKAVNYYTNRLQELATNLNSCYNWSTSVSNPTITLTQIQKTTTGKLGAVTYTLQSSVINDTNKDKIISKTCTGTACTKSGLSKYVNPANGVKLDMYNQIRGAMTETREYKLPSGTNRYILKPSGQIVSTKPTGGNYLDIGYANLPITFDSPDGVGSGTLTIRYSGLGDKCTGVAGYGAYTCAYKGDPGSEVRRFDYKYQTIDLDKPFTYYADGTNREAGFNWRYLPSQISKYITSNRGVSGDAVYDMEPMYVFDFTGKNRSKLSEIRLYNKSHSYNEFDASCKSGLECKSNFLKNSLFNGVISGCGLNSNWNSCSGR